MLSQLYIENIALIEKLELELKDGLNILSGETGAGKSIIIDSLNFVLGERADKTLIRYGTEYAVVQAVFENYATEAIEAYLTEIGYEPDEVLIIRRKMSVDGKNECRINGRVCTLSTLKALTELLVDIHGQHEHQSLLKVSNHIHLLDSIGDSKIDGKRQAVEKAYASYKNLKNEYAKYGDAAERARRLDILRYQLDEISKAAVKDGEEEDLLAQRKRIRNMEKILSAIQAAKSALDGYDGASVSANLKNANAALSSIATYDDDLPALQERLMSAKVEVEDISETIGDIMARFDFDAKSADATEARLETVRNIIRKYGGTYEALSEFYEKAMQEAEMLENAEDTVCALEKNIKQAKESLCNCAANLTEARLNIAEKFEKDMLNELRDLGMGNSTFKVLVDTTDDVDSINANGADSVEFLISPNVGEPLKPLAKIISGGEMSRFMLALKNIVAGIDLIGTMVFDEIDTGISGNISAVVSEKMCNISRNRQVIAVTHMPSLAAMADNHYLIAKSVENGKTLTHVTLLNDDTDEIARLIGGNDYSQFAIPHAKEMKAWAERYKSEL